MGWLVGFEPTYVRVTVVSVNRFTIATVCMTALNRSVPVKKVFISDARRFVNRIFDNNCGIVRDPVFQWVLILLAYLPLMVYEVREAC